MSRHQPFSPATPPGPDGILGPTGEPMTRADLPPPNTKRWVIRRKAEVVSGVRAGLISLEEACLRYNLSVDEFLSWQRLLEEHGVIGLRATRTKEYRGNGGARTSGDSPPPPAD